MRPGIEPEYLAASMVQLLVEMAVPAGRVDDVLQAFETVMRPARLDRRCVRASIWHAPDDLRCLRYLEEWLDAAAFERAAQGGRFGHLLELLETADRPPTFEVRTIGGIRGLDYVAALRGAARTGGGDGSALDAPGASRRTPRGTGPDRP